MANLIGQEIFSDVDESTQVYKVTHDGVGNSLPHMEKSFISFMFGDKAIEDFGLIVTIEEKMERGAYAPFTDLTSSYDTIDGQLYWGSKMEPNQIDLVLSTDGMTEKQLDNFREWFAPGKSKELVLSEHPNRAIMARVATSPVLSVLPFEKKASIKIKGYSYESSTTMYKGDISLSFIMDEPYWYLKNNYMPDYINKITLEPLTIDDENDNKVVSLDSKDMIKVMLEDGIPHQSIQGKTFFLGGNLLVSEEARVNVSIVENSRIGVITSESSGLDINSSTPGYLFYSGTAKSYPTIKFSIQPQFNNDYISCIRNSYINSEEKSYIQIGENKMFFTTPSILTGYNQVVSLFKICEGLNRIDLLEQVKNGVNNYYIRAWAIACINKISNSSFTSEDSVTLLTNLKKFFNTNSSFTFTINSKTGEAIGEFNIRAIQSGQKNENIDLIPFKNIKENVGDMICSDYLIIEGRNYLNSEGEITEEDCHKIISNEQLLNVLIFFKNMYL